MEKPKKHILVCCSFRASGEPQGVCYKKGTGDWLAYLEQELVERGMDGIQVTATGCLKVCDRGPAMVIYPDNVWYGGMSSEDDLDTILDALEEGETADDFVIA